ncbi:hypothetical protein [Brevundimonas sp. Root1423]|uniref:hypothetical protein n=1 Tax=Brevundimonas sp. Root1423 TaxID=1736462 RepID=UPI0006FB5C43|nr:hypothetical protein [Brevundimonas sp. Root1423]KQY84793.1 hypothetical protein ASD25_07175 [Brevundimonas sp. Root1423]
MEIFRSVAAGFVLSSCAGVALAQDITLTGDEAPSVQPWTQPASLSYVESSEDSEDKLALDAALKVSMRLSGVNTWFVRAVAHVSDQSKKEQETYKLQGGFHFENRFGGVEVSPGISRGELSLFTDVTLGWNSKADFADPGDPACVADPALIACGTQHQRSYRLAADFQPYMTGWAGTYTLIPQSDGSVRTGNQWAYSFAPQVVLFHDEVTEAVLNTAGVEEDGAVSGAKLVLSFALSPPAFQHRLNMRASYQHMQAFHRSDAREAAFPSSSSLIKASIDYEFGARSWDAGGGWSPSIGVAYTSGEDPLDGRKDKDDVTVGVRLTYRPPA